MSDKVVSQHIQDCFVLLCITDSQFLKTARLSIPSEYFGSSVSETIVQLCYKFYDTFNDAPKDHFFDELEAFMQTIEPEEAELYLAYAQKINEMDTPSHTYVLSRMNDFIKAREWKQAALEFVTLAEEGKFDDAKEQMTSALKTGARFDDQPLFYFDNVLPTWSLDSYSNELITLGIPVMGDSVILKRKQLVTILGSGKGKKSWWLCWLAREAIRSGLRVLYISHELTAEQVEMRFDMMFTGLVSRDHYSNVHVLHFDADGNKISDEHKKVDVITENIGQVRQARHRVRTYRGSLVIKKYPMYTCTIGEMERLIDHLETFDNFVPDVIINDYPTIMKLPRAQDDLRHQLNHAYMHHKRIADERDILVLTAAQTNSLGFETAHISRKAIGEDKRILANTDMIIAVGQTDAMEQLNQMRVNVLAAREDKDHLSCMVSTNIAQGQVVVDSWMPREQEEYDADEDD